MYVGGDDLCDRCGRACGQALQANGRVGTSQRVCCGCLAVAGLVRLWDTSHFNPQACEGLRPHLVKLSRLFLNIASSSTNEQCLASGLVSPGLSEVRDPPAEVIQLPADQVLQMPPEVLAGLVEHWEVPLQQPQQPQQQQRRRQRPESEQRRQHQPQQRQHQQQQQQQQHQHQHQQQQRSSRSSRAPTQR